MARRGKTGGGQGFGAPTATRPNGSVRTAAGGTRARGGAIVPVNQPTRTSVTGKFGSKYSASGRARRRALKEYQQVFGLDRSPLVGTRPSSRVLVTPAPTNPGGNTGVKKGNDKEPASGSAPNKSVFRRARPGEFAQRARGANARARLRTLARTGSAATQERARALAGRVGVRL
ncbi:MAG: hypothetical protein HWQ36_26175 [Nostoc sp. NMS2]|uniref:hypothetical protein n=1 Tax=Nostoc sp. NMS2 TaxID=2815389 RepID=UPI0025E5B63B|nr:hypothetical protein [Nostoc sp. NMS2]MBN3993875.1 hypothetical protein [Nostoc sp. NMS2]